MRPYRHAPARIVARSALVLLLAAACAAPPPRTRDSAATSRAGSEDDTTRLARLEREARALVSVSGCDAASGCRTAPVGWRGCGGPRTYVVYCAATTDSVALFRKLDELRRAESDYNERTGMVSTCEMRLPPSVAVQGGRCAASP